MLSASTPQRSFLLRRASVAGAALLMAARLIVGERSLGATGPRAWLDVAFTMVLTLIVVCIAVGLGQRVLRVDTQNLLDRTIWNAPVGLGILSYAVLGLGLAGLLRPALLAGLLVGAGWWAYRGSLEWLGSIRNALARGPQTWRLIRAPQRLLVLGGLLIVALSLLQALTPPYDYDGLMYHLQGPRLFLHAARIYALPENWQANGPATLDMMFLLGLTFGSDSFAKVLHLTCAMLLGMAVFSFGQRYVRSNGGWFAAAILISIPILPMWSSWAYTDAAWALFEFLAMYAVVLWKDEGRRSWLMAGGAFMGLALGSKYLALGTTAVLCLWVIWQSRADGLGRLIGNGVRFAGIALLVGSPWYVKNWLMAGNPVYPFLFGGLGWDPTRLEGLMAWLWSFGNGRTLVDYLRLPWDVYLKRGNFTGMMGGIEWPSPLFPVAALYPLIRHSPQLNTVAVVVLSQCFLWALGSQQTRFLLPAFAGMSLLTSAVAIHFLEAQSVRRWRSALIVGVGGAFLAIAVIIALMYAVRTRPWSVLIGTESKDAFLLRMDETYAAQRVIGELDPHVRVLMMWDGRGYYCDSRCLPDAAQSQWTDLAESTRDVEATRVELEARGISHLLLSKGDAAFVAQRDRTGRHRRALEYFREEFQPACARAIYEDTSAVVYELACK